MKVTHRFSSFIIYIASIIIDTLICFSIFFITKFFNIFWYIFT